jgi:hypothetical protein
LGNAAGRVLLPPETPTDLAIVNRRDADRAGSETGGGRDRLCANCSPGSVRHDTPCTTHARGHSWLVVDAPVIEPGLQPADLHRLPRSRRRMSANSQLSHLAHETVARGARIFLAGEHDLPYNRGIDI